MSSVQAFKDVAQIKAFLADQQKRFPGRQERLLLWKPEGIDAQLVDLKQGTDKILIFWLEAWDEGIEVRSAWVEHGTGRIVHQPPNPKPRTELETLLDEMRSERSCPA